MMRRIIGVRHAPSVHHLNKNATAFVVDCACYLLPPGDVCGSIDARRGEIALSVIRGLRAFGDDQAYAGALGIVIGGEVSRRSVGLGAATGHWSHDQAVR